MPLVLDVRPRLKFVNYRSGGNVRDKLTALRPFVVFAFTTKKTVVLLIGWFVFVLLFSRSSLRVSRLHTFTCS